MTGIIVINGNDIIPSEESVLQSQGVPENREVSVRIREILKDAMEILTETAEPECIMTKISPEEFEPVFNGEGKNADDALLADIYPQADRLGLFALTIGNEVSSRIEKLFSENNFALGSMLDSAASNAADMAVKLCEDLFRDKVIAETGTKDLQVLSYSPGYCGWHISAQQELFRFLDPGKIGITLNRSSLMTPIKSVSGVLVAGKSELHMFETRYSYCKLCRDRNCLERMKNLK